MLSPTQFNEIADALFEKIVETIDASDAADDIELNQGVLEISCVRDAAGKSKIIVNRHGPTQEIWVAAKSGGFHFMWVDPAWIDTRTGEALSHTLNRVLFEQSGVRVAFD